MPWCPKCKSEYIEGMTECVDCKVPLVDSLADEIQEEIDLVEVNDMPAIEIDEDGSEDIEKPEYAVKYQNYHEKAENFKSSAYTLISVGVIGVIALILLYLDILPIHLYGANKYLTYIVMGGLFIIFVIVGISSYISAGKFEKMAIEEDNLTAEIKEWVSQNIDAKSIMKAENEKHPDMAEEMQYFFYFGTLKKMVSGAFPQANADYLDNLLEELYAQLFES